MADKQKQAISEAQAKVGALRDEISAGEAELATLRQSLDRADLEREGLAASRAERIRKAAMSFLKGGGLAAATKAIDPATAETVQELRAELAARILRGESALEELRKQLYVAEAAVSRLEAVHDRFALSLAVSRSMAQLRPVDGRVHDLIRSGRLDPLPAMLAPADRAKVLETLDRDATWARVNNMTGSLLSEYEAGGCDTSELRELLKPQLQAEEFHREARAHEAERQKQAAAIQAEKDARWAKLRPQLELMDRIEERRYGT
jgi:hypothetical protein